MRWSGLLFAHWPVEPGLLRQHLPPGLELDTRDGTAWVGVVPFLMSNVAPRWTPPLPGVSRFLELNLRTYVTCDGKPGVWFFSLDAHSRIAVRLARVAFHLPYMDAVMAMSRSQAGDITYHSRRTHRGERPAEFEATYSSAGEFFHAAAGSLEQWLTARYCLYSADRRGRLYRGEIEHPPWSLAPARCEIVTNTFGERFGWDFAAKPHLLYAAPVDVRAWLIERCGS